MFLPTVSLDASSSAQAAAKEGGAIELFNHNPR